MRNLLVVSAMLLSTTFLLCAALAAVAPAQGQKESTKHGTDRASFDEKHMAGGHDEDLDHQAILGSKKEAEEFDHLPPEQSKKRLRKLASEQIDSNKDGLVTKEELTAHIQKSLMELDQEEVQERFEEIDEDGDGKASWEEYKKDAFGEDEELDEDGKPAMDEDDLKLMEEDQRYFKAADTNQDGILDKGEFAAFQNPEHHPHMHTTLVDLTLQEKDKDKSGTLDFNEFMGDVADKPDSEWYQIEKERFENEYDKNKDGILDQEEMKAWLVPDVSQTAGEEADHLFKEADDDKDGKLSLDEIVEEHQLFVGSEATNYGEQLEKMHDEL